MDINVKKGIHHTLWMWFLAGKCSAVKNGNITAGCLFDHECMSYGEQAGDWLEEMGVGLQDDWSFEINQAGVDIMYDEELQ